MEMRIKDLHIFSWLIICLLVFSACTKEDEPISPTEPSLDDVPKAPEQGSTANRTVLVYMVADNDLGTKGFASSDLQEMSDAILSMAAGTYSNNNLLVYYDQNASSQKPVLFRLVKEGEIKVSATDPTKKELVIHTAQEVIKEFPYEITSTQPASIEEVMQLAYSTFPASSYGFVYWSHGDGWTPGKYETEGLRSVSPLRYMGADWNNSSANSSGSFKTGIPELAEVLKKAPKKLDFLLLDACFMMSMEVAYELRDCAEFIISSPTETPGPGAPYNQVVPQMFASSDAAVQLATAYYQFYENKYNPDVTNANENWTGGVSIAVIKGSKLKALAATTEMCLPEGPVDVTSLRENVFDYDKRNYTHVGYYDMHGLMEKIIPSETLLVQWKRAYADALAFWSTTGMNYSAYARMFSMAGTNGVSHYIPTATDSSSARDVEYRSTSWYKDAGLSKLGW